MIISALKSVHNHKLQAHSSLQKEYDKTRLTEPVITRELNDITKQLGTYFKGLEYSVKTASSVDERLKRTEISNSNIYNGDLYFTLHDGIRYTEICDHNKIPETTENTVKLMEEKGYTVTRLDNLYNHPYKLTGYKGIHINAISPQGQRIEMQIHSEFSLEQKEKGHKIYEQLRNPDIALDNDKRQMLIDKIKEIHGAVPNPEGIENIKSYCMNKDDIYNKYTQNRSGWNIKVNEVRIDEMETGEYQLTHDGKLVVNLKEYYHDNREVDINKTITTSDKEIDEYLRISKTGEVLEASDGLTYVLEPTIEDTFEELMNDPTEYKPISFGNTLQTVIYDPSEEEKIETDIQNEDIDYSEEENEESGTSIE